MTLLPPDPNPDKHPLVIATTTLSRVYDVRARLAVMMAMACRTEQYPFVVVDGGSDRQFIKNLEREGAILIHEGGKAEPGVFGPARRMAIAHAHSLTALDGFVLGIEPEKYNLIPKVRRMVDAMTTQGADLGITDRGSLASYPKVQQLAEPLGNFCFNQLLGNKLGNVFLDAWSGPRMMNARAVKLFLKYDGHYGDKWESIFIPIVWAVAAGLRVVSIPVDYAHPPEQTLAEDTPEMAVKRVEQLYNIIPAVYAEAKKLGLI